MAFQPEEDLTCPVCQDIFKDPVVLTCSHSLCTVCVRSWWTEKPSQECPVCRKCSPTSDPPLNLALRNLCQAFLQRQEEDHVCPLHSETYKLFCLKDQQPVCVVCRDSDKHRAHQVRPIDEVTKQYKAKLQESLNPLKDRLERVQAFREKCALSLAHIKTQSEQAANLIEKEFLKLHDFLSQQQESRMKALKKEEEQKTHRMKGKIEAVSREVETLSETIRATEEQLRAADVSFLLKYKSAVERVLRCPLLEEPQLDPGALMDQAKHVGNLRFNIWSSMKRLVSFTPVVLDPNTAHPQVVVSDDLTSLTWEEEQQQLPLNPERVTDPPLVRGYMGFDSGSHTWDVEVGDSDEWTLGVSTISALHTPEDEDFPDDAGFWGIEFDDNRYTVINLDKKKPSEVKLKSKPRRIRLHLEWNKRKLTLYDADTNTRIHSFTQLYHHTLFPVFSGTSLFILPQNI